MSAVPPENLFAVNAMDFWWLFYFGGLGDIENGVRLLDWTAEFKINT